MSIIGDFINRITNKRLPEPKDNEPRGQFTYSQILDLLKSNGGMEEFYQEVDKIKENADMYFPSRVHGIEHTERVTFLAEIMVNLDGLEEQDKRLILAAARLHDVGRIDNSESKEHGLYGKEKIEREGLLEGFSKSDKKIIEFVIEQHSLSREENEKAISKLPFWQRDKYSTILSYLKDADALDRVRIANQNAKLDPSRLRNRSAKELVDFSYENFNRFNEIKSNYLLQKMLSLEPALREEIEYVNEYIDSEWIVENMDFLKTCHSRGILQNMKKDDMNFIDFLEDTNLTGKIANQVLPGDFEYIRANGYNITYESFIQIVASYKDGTLEKLRSSGKLLELFSYETFKKYGIQQDFENRTSETNDITRDELLKKVNEGKTTILLDETFNSMYMLYRNMYINHKDAFDMYTYCDLDANAMHVSGILEKVRLEDLNKLKDLGYKLSLRDLVELASNFSPEEYRNLMDSNSASKLFSYDSSKDPNGQEFEELWNKFSRLNPNIYKQDLIENYALYKEVFFYADKIYAIPEMMQYPISEIYPALTKIQEAEMKLQTFQGKQVKFSAKTLLDLIEFSNKTNILDSENEEDKDEVIGILLENGKLKDDPRLIEYVTKKNKVYRIEKAEDIIDYNKFCMEKILEDNEISLGEAKINLINSLLCIDCPKGEYRHELEENIIDELYYYRRYKQEGKIETGEQELSDIDMVIDKIIAIMDSNNIKDFKDKLYDVYQGTGNLNFNRIFEMTEDALRGLAKQDLVENLNKTKEMLDRTPSETITHNGETIPIKNLRGQEFVLAMTTVMPNCSSITKNRFQMDKDLIKNNMLNRPLNANNRCTSIISDTMLAHAMSALQDEELKYAYVPEDISQISIQGKHDLSTIKKLRGDGREVRETSRATQYRTARDLVNTTTEEHNETVLNDIYPRYILCFDKISDVAIQKYQMLKKEYAEIGIDQEIEILLVDGKDKYLPRIEQNLDRSLSEITREIQETGTISSDTIDRFFNSRERNITLQTIQAINSSSYRDELWNPEKNTDKFRRLTEVLEMVTDVMPKEHLGKVSDQVDLLLGRKYPEDTSKKRFYDHSYKKSFDVVRLQGIRDRIDERMEERDNKSISSLTVEEIDVGEEGKEVKRKDDELEH